MPVFRFHEKFFEYRIFVVANYKVALSNGLANFVANIIWDAAIAADDVAATAAASEFLNYSSESYGNEMAIFIWINSLLEKDIVGRRFSFYRGVKQG
uniref:Uncharacterized protein n=1 Tax=Megaselia scalaris TaxID=36166 RepID=T1GGP2_MEGSC